MTYNHRVIILNRGSMVAFQWREFSPPLSSAHRLLPKMKEREVCILRSPGNAEYILLPQPPPSARAISLEWYLAVTLHILVGKNCITFFPFSCEACSLYLVLWLCAYNQQAIKSNTSFWIETALMNIVFISLC